MPWQTKSRIAAGGWRKMQCDECWQVSWSQAISHHPSDQWINNLATASKLMLDFCCVIYCCEKFPYVIWVSMSARWEHGPGPTCWTHNLDMTEIIKWHDQWRRRRNKKQLRWCHMFDVKGFYQQNICSGVTMIRIKMVILLLLINALGQPLAVHGFNIFCVNIAKIL